jgi:hypothetical protein
VNLRVDVRKFAVGWCDGVYLGGGRPWAHASAGAQDGPGLAAGVLDDPGQEQGEPAESDMGAEAVFPAVVDRPQVDDLLHVAPAAFHFEQLLVPGCDVLGDSFGSAVRSRYFPSRFSSAFALAASVRSSPPG